MFLQKIEASPAALLVKAKHHRKILFSLREKEIRRAQNKKSKEYFSMVRRALGSGGGAASFVGGFPKMRSDFVQGVEPNKKQELYSRFLFGSRIKTFANF
ncbi:MAG: hypothetical protein A3H17_00740 [Candidatus Levybacteria bacterium RIFCSPLOWO2_12_FULL_37_14]|nr:MAG: hypothetical protein A3H17_00740 [Candidatus Levybacteria bacterium RIFCSPLOWO2_12_FULL_37_14]